MSVTQINAGTQHNVVPDICTFVVDIRSNEFYSNEELFKEITSHISCEAKARSFRLNSSRIDINHPFVQRAVELGKTPFGSPTLSDQALMPFPSVKIGPGKSSRSHTADRNTYGSRNRRSYRQLYFNIGRTKIINHSFKKKTMQLLRKIYSICFICCWQEYSFLQLVAAVTIRIAKKTKTTVRP